MFNVNLAFTGRAEGLPRVVSLSSHAKHELEKLKVIFFSLFLYNIFKGQVLTF